MGQDRLSVIVLIETRCPLVLLMIAREVLFVHNLRIVMSLGLHAPRINGEWLWEISAGFLFENLIEEKFYER